jgi:putative transposase
MARRPRVVIPGLPHHVLQRAADGCSLFASARDYAYYLSLVRDQSACFGLDVWAYCLMPDHVHLICVPRAADSLARVFNTVHMKFALHLLRDSARSGPARRDGAGLSHALRDGVRDPADRNPSRPDPSRLSPFSRGRFRSCVLDDASLFEEVRFVESNPVRKGLVELPWDYEWSSARSRVFGTPDPVLSNRFPLALAVSDWSEYLLGAKLEEVLARTRANLKTGRPCGDAEFVSGLELLTRRRLRPGRPGRPAGRRDAKLQTEASVSAPSTTRGISNGVAGSADRGAASLSAAHSSRSQSLKACPAPSGSNPVSAPVSTPVSARVSTRGTVPISTRISTPAPESALKSDRKAGSKYTAAPVPKHAASGPTLRPERIKR